MSRSRTPIGSFTGRGNRGGSSYGGGSSFAGDYGRREQFDRGAPRGRQSGEHFPRGGRGGGRGGGPALVASQVGPKKVETNHYRLGFREPITIYKYLVEILNDAEPTRIPKNEEKELILAEYLKQKSVQNTHLIPYDSDRILITMTRLPQFQDAAPMTFRRVAYSVSITFQSEHTVGRGDTELRAKDEAAPLLDIILQWAAKLTNEKQGRAKFVPASPSERQLVALDNRRDLRGPRNALGGKYAWLGHMQTVQVTRSVSIARPEGNGGNGNGGNPFQKVTQSNWTMMLSAAAVVAVKRQPLHAYLHEAFGLSILGNQRRHEDASLVAAANKKMRGLKIETHYMPDECGNRTKRTYKIEGISLDASARTFKFEHDGQETSPLEYFRTRYGINLRHPDAPLLLVKPAKRNIMLPIELVDMSLQKLSKAYDDPTKSAMASLMTLEPQQRKDYVNHIVHDVFKDNPILQKFGIEVNNVMEIWDATVIAAPWLQYGQWTGQPQRGAWNLQGKKFLKPVELKSAVVIDLTGRLRPAAETFDREMANNARSLGITGKLDTKWYSGDMHSLATLRNRITSVSRQQWPQIVFVVLPQRDTEMYRTVKETFDTYIPTQCLVARNTPVLEPNKRGNPAGHFGNIWSKVNQKLQGRNHDLNYEQTERITFGKLQSTDRSFMILGMNMVHPATPAIGRFKHAPSVAALVASLDPKCTVYGHAVRVQPRGKTTVEHLEEMLYDIMTHREKYSKDGWPSRIVLLREGVSESQMEDVYLQELIAIERCYSLRGLPNPSITAMVIQRNHSIRLFEQRMEDPRQNLGPGTVVMQQGVHPGRFANFFLISHAGIKGTTRPCRYFILRNEIGESGRLPLEFWVYFAYQAAHLYGRCQRAVSAPAPLLYAKLLADRGKLLAMDYFQSNLGLSVFSDTASVSSGGAGPEVEPTADKMQELFAQTNQQLQRLTVEAPNMFYC